MDWIGQRPIAHRGLHGESTPENSLRAFEDAISEGYAIEFDVRLSADGVPVVYHDRQLDRLTQKTGNVDNLDWETLSACRLSGTSETIPRLETVLDAVDGTEPLLIELKSAGRPGALESTVASVLDDYTGAFAVQSFNPFTVDWFRRHRPGWSRGQLAGLSTEHGLLSRTVVNRLLSNVYTRPDFVGYRHDFLPTPAVSRNRDRGRPVLAWTVQAEAEMRRIASFADAVIFEGFRP